MITKERAQYRKRLRSLVKELKQMERLALDAGCGIGHRVIIEKAEAQLRSVERVSDAMD